LSVVIFLEAWLSVVCFDFNSVKIVFVGILHPPAIFLSCSCIHLLGI